MNEGVVDSDGGDCLSLSHVEETASTSRSSWSARVKAAGICKLLQKRLPRGNPHSAYDKKQMTNTAKCKKLQEH